MELLVSKWHLGSPIEAPRETGTDVESKARNLSPNESPEAVEML